MTPHAASFCVVRGSLVMREARWRTIPGCRSSDFFCRVHLLVAVSTASRMSLAMLRGRVMDACAGDVVSGICMALDFLLSCASGRLSESAPAPRTPGLSHSWRCLQPLGLARALAWVRAFVAHAAHQPVARRWNVDQDAIADPREGQAAGLIEPAAHRAGMAINLFGE